MTQKLTKGINEAIQKLNTNTFIVDIEFISRKSYKDLNKIAIEHGYKLASARGYSTHFILRRE